MSELPITITDAAAALRAGNITSAGLTRALLERADRVDPLIGCYIKRLDEMALAAAEAADADFTAGVDKGPLQGIPLGIKDILATNEAPTTANSQVLDPAWGDQGDGPVVARLRAAGAVFMGKLTTMEFAIGLPDPVKPFPVPRNPWDTDRWPGGSSSGTGNGIAAGLFLGGLGTDTGGSIRIPAAFCGITGMKQTFGRTPKSGCTPLGYSLDHVGPMARSVRDCATMLNVMAGHDASDPCSVDAPVPDYLESLTGSLDGLRIGVERTHHTRVDKVLPEVIACFESAVALLARHGADVREVSFDLYDELTVAAFETMRAEAYAYHRRDLQQRWFDYGRFTRTFIGAGALANPADYVQAQRVRRYGRQKLAELMQELDVLVTPTYAVDSPLLADLSWSFIDVPMFTPVWNATGSPALSVPMGFSDRGLPLGLQIVAKPFDEGMAFRVGDAYQRLTNWHLQVPPI